MGVPLANWQSGSTTFSRYASLSHDDGSHDVTGGGNDHRPGHAVLNDATDSLAASDSVLGFRCGNVLVGC
jgi:hypothetical protein